MVREWRLEELARVEAFKRAPPNPMAVPLSSAKLTDRVLRCLPALEATQGQMDGFCSQLPYTCYLEEVASVGD